MNKTYVYKNTEVMLTGRKATRKNTPKTPRRLGTTSDNTDTLFEVVPADPKNGSWTSWVILEDLFEILDGEDSK